MKKKILMASLTFVLGAALVASVGSAQIKKDAPVVAPTATGVVDAGKKVSIDYTLKIEGQEIETTTGKKPLAYIHGQKMIIPGLEKELQGMKVGEQKSITIKPEDAYGQVRPEAFKEFPKTSFPDVFQPQKGAIMQIQNPDGMALAGLVWEVKDAAIVINYNHPLAGKTLEFNVKVVDVQNADLPPAPAKPAEEVKK